MNHFTEEVFIGEIGRQAEFALLALRDLASALGSRRTDNYREWYSVQALLVAVGNISKILWPASKDFKKRGEMLRLALAVGDDSVLASRTFRNHFEHFDERLEVWASSTTRFVLVDSNIGPTGCIDGLGADAYLRNFDTSKWAITFAGEEHLLKPIASAVADIRAKASEIIRESRDRR